MGEGWSTANWFKPPSNYIAGRPQATVLVLWCFLFCVILVIHKYRNR